MRAATASNSLPRLAASLALVAAAAWGLRLTILEGFVYAWPRGFSGDFSALMYEPRWWDGTRIMYGPVFVFERWLVNAWPRIFTVSFFALANIPAVALAFVLSLAAARATRTTAFVAFAAWCCFRWLFYAFSVAANPEILELLFLALAWYAASRAKPTIAWVAVVVAAATKVIPVVFAPLLLLRASRKAIAAAVVTGTLIVATTAAGQHLSFRETVAAILIPTRNAGGGSVSQRSEIWPIPSVYQDVGLNTAIARATGMPDGDPRLPLVQNVADVLTVVVYLWSALVAFRVLRGRHALPEATRLALSYGLFFALMPLATFQTHPHTFVFLLPAWTAIIAMLTDDGDRGRATEFGAAFLLLFVFGGMPSAAVPVDRLLHTRLVTSLVFVDPIWANLGVVLALSAYALRRTREASAVIP
ncbi:MAG: DUF2029 domain-containing protein [Acidobacteria bacterium]|nr:DUF2029 domain-containing protein [Acidobacteriota bacterium]